MNDIALQEADFGIRTAPDTVRVERLLPGPIERVWEFLTVADLRAQWLAAGEMEPREGGLVDLVFNNNTLTENDEAPPAKYAKYGGESHLPGRITEWNPPRALAFDWGSGNDNSHVRFELAPQGNQVRLVVTHGRLGTRDGMLSVSAGWHAHLDILRDRMEGRAPDGFWRSHARLEAEYDRRLT